MVVSNCEYKPNNEKDENFNFLPSGKLRKFVIGKINPDKS